MDRLGRPRGLVRYDSLDGLAGNARRIVRPRIVLYTALGLVGAAVAFVATRGRTDYEAALLRLTGEPYALDGGDVRDAFQVHIVNKRAEAASYRVEVEPAPAMAVLVPIPIVSVASLGDARVPVFLTVVRSSFHAEFPVRVHVTRVDDAKDDVVVTGTFLGPRP
jgi:hypothetical protein